MLTQCLCSCVCSANRSARAAERQFDLAMLDGRAVSDGLYLPEGSYRCVWLESPIHCASR
jgi:hypothetical protein